MIDFRKFPIFTFTLLLYFFHVQLSKSDSQVTINYFTTIARFLQITSFRQILFSSKQDVDITYRLFTVDQWFSTGVP